MLKNISNLGFALDKKEQKNIKGGTYREDDDSKCGRDMSAEEHNHCCLVDPFNIYC
ncbi:hypothetical protein [Tenacibaculum sp.]|uniref:hypothetical protein n=1 Tax=Tenacibaculum sp. TaxID=1906242 RepID=UPI003D0CF1D9